MMRKLENSLHVIEIGFNLGYVATITVNAVRYTTMCLPKSMGEITENNQRRRIIQATTASQTRIHLIYHVTTFVPQCQTKNS